MDDCPVICVKPEPPAKKIDPYRREMCKSCPKRIKRKNFRRATEALWFAWFGETPTLEFATYDAAFNAMLTAREMPRRRRRAKAQRLVEIFEAEKARADRIERETP